MPERHLERLGPVARLEPLERPERVVGQRQPAQLVVRVRIDPRVEEDDIRPDAGQQRRQDLLQFSQTAFIGYGMLRRAFVADFDAMEQPFQYIRTAWHQRYLLDDPFFFVALFDVFILYGFPKKLLLENLFCKDFK